MMKADERRANFKKTLDEKEGRRRREETTRQIRKSKKEENLRKRRQAMVKEDAALEPVNPSTTASQRKFGSISDIPELTRLLTSPNSSKQELLEATRGFRRLLSVEKNPPVDEVLNAGVQQNFVKNLTADLTASTLIFESAWALTNIASTSRTNAVVEAGAIDPMVKLLMHENSDVREQAAWCLGNIAGDNKDYRDYLLSQNALSALLLNVQQPANMSILNNVTWTISNLCRGKPAPSLILVEPAIDVMAELLNREGITNEVRSDALWALSYLSDGPNEQIERVIRTGITSKLIGFLREKNPLSLLTPTVRCLGNFVTGSDIQTQAVVDEGILDYLGDLLGHSKRNIRKESCWLASNIAAGTHNQITSLMDKPGVMTQLIDNAIHGSWEIKKEALWALSNICTTGNDLHIQTLIQYEGLRPLSEALSLTNADGPVLIACLDAIDEVLQVGERNSHDYGRIFDEYNGIEYLENLQEHPSDSVYKKTIKIIEAYFGGDEEEDENLAPTMTDSGTFGFGISPTAKQLFPATQASPFAFGTVSNRVY